MTQRVGEILRRLNTSCVLENEQQVLMILCGLKIPFENWTSRSEIYIEFYKFFSILLKKNDILLFKNRAYIILLNL